MIRQIKLVILSGIFALVTTGTNAQCSAECTSKKGTNVLPEAGEFSLGFDAMPVLNYFGNLFGDGQNQAGIGFQQQGVIMGQYMKTTTTAYRGKVGINVLNQKADSTETNSSGVNLGAGIMKYRGKTRLQGYYGGELGFNFQNSTLTTGSVETETKTLGLGARGFVGAQYFFAPKMSIGAEYGWGPQFQKVGEDSNFNLSVDNQGGAIYLSVFF